MAERTKTATGILFFCGLLTPCLGQSSGFNYMHHITKQFFRRSGNLTLPAKAPVAPPGMHKQEDTALTAVLIALGLMLIVGLVVVRKCSSMLRDAARSDEAEAFAKYGPSGESYGSRKLKANQAAKSARQTDGEKEPADVSHYGAL
mmetsp:Transcript_38540/g.83490  ORF Transcript_38540/g.83490 Transcript_38540/m.83490 type:complete len:146 (+) Transcript_38540:3-440(+)